MFVLMTYLIWATLPFCSSLCAVHMNSGISFNISVLYLVCQIFCANLSEMNVVISLEVHYVSKHMHWLVFTSCVTISQMVTYLTNSLIVCMVNQSAQFVPSHFVAIHKTWNKESVSLVSLWRVTKGLYSLSMFMCDACFLVLFRGTSTFTHMYTRIAYNDSVTRVQLTCGYNKIIAQDAT